MKQTKKEGLSLAAVDPSETGTKSTESITRFDELRAEYDREGINDDNIEKAVNRLYLECIRTRRTPNPPLKVQHVTMPEWNRDVLMAGYEKARALIDFMIENNLDTIGFSWLAVFYCLATDERIEFSPEGE